MDNELLIAAIDAAEQNSYSSEGDSQLSADRAFAIDMYLGKNLEPAPKAARRLSTARYSRRCNGFCRACAASLRTVMTL
jgi:hypothetical protein